LKAQIGIVMLITRRNTCEINARYPIRSLARLFYLLSSLLWILTIMAVKAKIAKTESIVIILKLAKPILAASHTVVSLVLKTSGQSH